MVRENEQQARVVFSLGVLLVDKLTDGLRSNLPHLATYGKKVPILLVDAAGRAGELDEVPVFARLEGTGKDLKAMVEDVLRLCAEKLKAGTAARS